jgi:hypothetical protein
VLGTGWLLNALRFRFFALFEEGINELAFEQQKFNTYASFGAKMSSLRLRLPASLAVSPGS